MTINDGTQNHVLADKEAKTILGLEFVGNGYGKEDSLDKGLPTWNEKNIKNFIALTLLIAQKVGISDIVDSLTSIDSQKPLSAKQGKTLADTFLNYYTKTQTDTQIDSRINSIIGTAPANFDTLKEISDALADDDNQISALISSLSQKVSKSDIVDDLSTVDSTKPLSAKMGNSLMVSKLSISDLRSAISNISGPFGYYNKNSIDNLLLGYQSKSSPLGYVSGFGSGGEVVQSTSKATSVTLNTSCGRITTHNAALAANSYVDFTCLNSYLSSFDVVVCNVSSGAAVPLNYSVRACINYNAIRFRLKNESASSLSESVVINFLIIKGSNN